LTSTAEIEKLANQQQQYWNLAPELILKVVGIELNVRANKQGYPPTVNCTFYKVNSVKYIIKLLGRGNIFQAIT
jgi:hypothetical protein